ncbi:hypothetical protein JL721_8138 [Aureococcus anophagefferens]|nr:hypothetical protein JL721_8138 [Aureococcus anophagefferens]
MDCRRSCVLAVLLATASAFAPRTAPRCGVAVSESPLDRLGGLLGGKKAPPPPIVEDVAVDDVAPGEMTTAVEGLTPELDGLRKANALFNQGLIGRDEIDEYSRTLGEAQREKARAAAAAAAAEKKRERERREASERVANASLSAASFGTALAVDEGVRVESEVVLDDGDVFDPGLEDDPGAIFSAVARAGLAAAAKVTGDKAKELTESVVADTKAAARAAAEEKVAEKQFKAAAEKARADELQRQEYKRRAASAMARDRLQEASDSLLLEANYLDDDTRAKLAADLAARLVKKTEAAAEEKRREKS